MSKLLFKNNSWTLHTLDDIWKAVKEIAVTKYQLDFAEPQIEVVSADQMLHHHARNAMPTSYAHWSFGKRQLASEREWKAGVANIAYETIINTDPMVCYIMENNTATMQALVLAHAVCGHGSFFKGNYLFQEWTDPGAVFNVLQHAKRYVAECELAHGPETVEKVLDACHALYYHGIDHYKRRRIPKAEDTQERNKQLADARRRASSTMRDLFELKQEQEQDRVEIEKKHFDWPFPEENLLYFIEKNSPILDQWQKELVRIVRKSAQYFYPQIRTKVMNEGWASFWHYQLMQDLYDEGYIGEGSMLEFYQSHTSVCNQPDHAHMNPYALGFEMFMDLKRACEEPTEEDYKYLPLAAGKPWLETLKWIMENFNDEMFVTEFLGPNVVRKLKLFCIEDNTKEDHVEILRIQEKDDIYGLRKHLAKGYTLDHLLPIIEVVDYDARGDRTLSIQHRSIDGRLLDEANQKAVIKYLFKLWGYPIKLILADEHGDAKSYTKRSYA